MRGEYFWSEKAMTHPFTKQEGSTQPLIRESPLLSYKITQTFEFWFCVNWSGPLTFSFPSTLQSACICFTPLCTEEDPHLSTSCFWWNSRFVVGLSGISWLLLVGHSHKSRQQEVSDTPGSFNVHFSSLLHISASSPEFRLRLVYLYPLGHSWTCQGCSEVYHFTESLILGRIWKRQLEII